MFTIDRNGENPYNIKNIICLIRLSAVLSQTVSEPRDRPDAALPPFEGRQPICKAVPCLRTASRVRHPLRRIWMIPLSLKKGRIANGIYLRRAVAYFQ